MFAMVGGFITNIVLDFIFVWIYEMGMKGAATATIAGQGVTAAIAIIYALYIKKFYVYVSLKNVKEMCGAIFRVGLAPFGLALTPNISLVFINRFSASYGGEKAIATYACVSYIICIIYLILQGVGDGSQPLMSRFYGEKDQESLRGVQRMAYIFAIILAVCGGIIMYVNRANIGGVFGASYEVSIEISKIVPIFLVSLPFVAITRIATAGFYATEKSGLSYILTFIEPVLMLIFTSVLCMKDSYPGNLWSETAAMLGYSELGKNLQVPSTVRVMESISPYGCMLQVFLLLFCYSLTLGFVILVGNLYKGKTKGMVFGPCLFRLYARITP